MKDPYDPCEEFNHKFDRDVNAPDDPDRDSELKAKARFSKIMDAHGGIDADSLNRALEGKRKAGRDPSKALECADPHGILDESDRRLLLENRGFDPDEHL